MRLVLQLVVPLEKSQPYLKYPSWHQVQQVSVRPKHYNNLCGEDLVKKKEQSFSNNNGR